MHLNDGFSVNLCSTLSFQTPTVHTSCRIAVMAGLSTGMYSMWVPIIQEDVAKGVKAFFIYIQYILYKDRIEKHSVTISVLITLKKTNP